MANTRSSLRLEYEGMTVKSITLIIFNKSNNTILLVTRYGNYYTLNSNINKQDETIYDTVKSIQFIGELITPDIIIKSDSRYDRYIMNLNFIIDLNMLDVQKLSNIYKYNHLLRWVNYNIIKSMKHNRLDIKLHYMPLYEKLDDIQHEIVSVEYKEVRFTAPVFCTPCYNKKTGYNPSRKYNNSKWIGIKRDKPESCHHCHNKDLSCRQIIQCDGCDNWFELFMCRRIVITWCKTCKDYSTKCVDIEQCIKCSNYYLSDFHHRDKSGLKSYYHCYNCC